jgi:hypothetical protein
MKKARQGKVQKVPEVSLPLLLSFRKKRLRSILVADGSQVSVLG